jgi:magnesium chelatase family protein
MLATARCAVLVGVDAIPVRVEADVAKSGLPEITIVGLVEAAVRESQVRIRSALFNCGYRLPAGRITVSLAPADMPKGGSGFDLSIALAMLAGAGLLSPSTLEEYLTVGELSLNGELRPVRGALSYALCERARGRGRLIMPAAVAAQAVAVPGVEVLGALNLPAVVSFLRGEGPLATPSVEARPPDPRSVIDLADVRGQELARRAFEIAAAGGHNLVAIGPPGTGKSMLASRLPTILPPLTLEESLETSAVWSVAGLLEPGRALLAERPLRAPHHTASDAGLVGGGVPPRPGEISLAHNGVLFLDELPEFRRRTLEALRQPLEQGLVVVARAAHRITFPARVQLVATMNPCACGMLGAGVGRRGACTCSAEQVRRYRGRISGPLLDRIDLHVEVPAVPLRELEQTPYGEPSAVVRERVVAARSRQDRRYAGTGARCNAELTPALLREHCELGRPALDLIARVAQRLHLSARGFDRVRKVARTIADLAGRDEVGLADVAEAVSFRVLDRDHEADASGVNVKE